MKVIRTQTVTTRKRHICSACLQEFKKGTKMEVSTVVYQGIYIWRTCQTCTEILDKYRNIFSDDGIFYEGCVNDELKKGQTPENLLIELNKKYNI